MKEIRGRLTADEQRWCDVDDLQAFAQGVFDAQPFSRFIGAQLAACGPGEAELSLAIVDQLKQQHGFVHGGALSYLADNALTSEFKINYLKPALGAHLLARAKARNAGKRQAVCQCEVHAVKDEEETLCALAQGTIVAAVPA
jgi:uncharacterized protein (TIGR00369 family)